MKSQYDVVILGAGHNGLVAAAYLARAGLSVLLLEKNEESPMIRIIVRLVIDGRVHIAFPRKQ